jgi:hypothetical protein
MSRAAGSTATADAAKIRVSEAWRRYSRAKAIGTKTRRRFSTVECNRRRIAPAPGLTLAA